MTSSQDGLQRPLDETTVAQVQNLVMADQRIKIDTFSTGVEEIEMEKL